MKHIKEILICILHIIINISHSTKINNQYLCNNYTNNYFFNNTKTCFMYDNIIVEININKIILQANLQLFQNNINNLSIYQCDIKYNTTVIYGTIMLNNYFTQNFITLNNYTNINLLNYNINIELKLYNNFFNNKYIVTFYNKTYFINKKNLNCTRCYKNINHLPIFTKNLIIVKNYNNLICSIQNISKYNNTLLLNFNLSTSKTLHYRILIYILIFCIIIGIIIISLIVKRRIIRKRKKIIRHKSIKLKNICITLYTYENKPIRFNNHYRIKQNGIYYKSTLIVLGLPKILFISKTLKYSHICNGTIYENYSEVNVNTFILIHKDQVFTNEFILNYDNMIKCEEPAINNKIVILQNIFSEYLHLNIDYYIANTILFHKDYPYDPICKLSNTNIEIRKKHYINLNNNLYYKKKLVITNIFDDINN